MNLNKNWWKKIWRILRSSGRGHCRHSNSSSNKVWVVVLLLVAAKVLEVVLVVIVDTPSAYLHGGKEHLHPTSALGMTLNNLMVRL